MNFLLRRLDSFGIVHFRLQEIHFKFLGGDYRNGQFKGVSTAGEVLCLEGWPLMGEDDGREKIRTDVWIRMMRVERQKSSRDEGYRGRCLRLFFVANLARGRGQIGKPSPSALKNRACVASGPCRREFQGS